MTPPLSAEPWALWLADVSADLRPETAYPLRQLVERLFELDTPENAERAALGVAARRLLAFALNTERNDPWLVAAAAKAVSRTYDTDPAEAGDLLRRLFAPDRLATHGALELSRTAESITALASHAPDLVRELYVAAFSYEETSKDETQFVPSAVMPLRSNRKQDYESGLYILGQEYPAFLATAPGPATAALIAIVEQYNRRERYVADVRPDHIFDMHGVEAHVRADGSTYWDELTSYRHDDALRMLDAFTERVKQLAVGGARAASPSRRSAQRASSAPTSDVTLSNADSRAHLEEIVATIIFENRLAVIWRRLLEAGTAHPTEFRDVLTPLAWAVPLLTGTETTVAAGAFLTAVYPLLTPSEREQVEYTILHLARRKRANSGRGIERTRGRLLGCLPEEFIATDEARSVLTTLRAREAVPANRPRAPLSAIREGPSPGRTVEEEWLEEKGVAVDAEPNRTLLALVRAANDFSTTHLNDAPTREQALGVLPTLKALSAGLADVNAAADVCASAELALSSASARIARGAPATCDGDLGAFITATLLAASQSERPLPGQGDLSGGGNGWSPAPRIEAAAGLPSLCRHTACMTSEVRSALERLSTDPAPAVRAQIFWRITSMWEVDREFVWNALERAATSESNVGVLRAAIRGGLSPLKGINPARVARLTAAIADPLPREKTSNDLRNECAALLTGLAIWKATPLALDHVARITDDPAGHADEARYIMHQIRGLLVVGDPDIGDSQADDARRRSVKIVAEIVTHGAAQFSALHAEAVGAHPASPEAAVTEQLRELFSVLDGAASQLYFVAKASAEPERAAAAADDADDDDADPPPTAVQLGRLYAEAGPIIDELADVGLGPVAHHLVQVLEILVPHDPPGVFQRVARVVRAARASNYEYDSLAQGIVVRLGQRYLAE